MQTTRGNVIGVIELPACMQRGQDEFKRRDFFRGVLVDRNPSAVVADRNAFAIFVKRHIDVRRVAIGGLIYSVVYDFPEKMMESGLPRSTDKHSGSPANGLQPL